MTDKRVIAQGGTAKHEVLERGESTWRLEWGDKHAELVAENARFRASLGKIAEIALDTDNPAYLTRLALIANLASAAIAKLP